MFRIESYVTPILLSYVDKYVKDFKPADAQVSLWGGGVALHNLVLKPDVLQQEVALPFNLVSGRIHELLIQVPWTKIMSEPIVITIDTIECVLSLRTAAQEQESQPQDSTNKGQLVETPPGYMQALVRRIVSNISLKVHHLIVKYVEDDIVLSLNVKYLSVNSADANWRPAFATDIDQAIPVIRRLVMLDDLTLCLDHADADGKIRFYQEPVLYRCQLNFRVLTRLASLNTRRPTSVVIHLSCSRLAWGFTTDQLSLLLRLLKERPQGRPHTPTVGRTAATNTSSINAGVGESVANGESWSAWAWSWLPSAGERPQPEEVSAPPAALPVCFTACVDSLALVFKLTESEQGRKKTRVVLELTAQHSAVKGVLRAPTNIKVSFGARNLVLKSSGRCVCGNLGQSPGEPTKYLSRLNSKDDVEWNWPAETFSEEAEEASLAKAPPAKSPVTEWSESPDKPSCKSEDVKAKTEGETSENEPADFDHILWQKMDPVVFLKFTHERAPPDPAQNPYENPPRDFEYSDWRENCVLRIRIAPLELQVCTGLIHRLTAIHSIFADFLPVSHKVVAVRALTVEECESLSENLPLRQFEVELGGCRVTFLSHDHDAERTGTIPSRVAMHLELPTAHAQLTMPLYPNRVCAAASQLQRESGSIWTGARLHASVTLQGLRATVAPLDGSAAPRPFARADLRLVVHQLLNKRLFTKKHLQWLTYTLHIKEASLCGSAPRIQCALEVIKSLVKEKNSFLFVHTTLITDALQDEDLVTIDVTIEDFYLRGYLTPDLVTTILALQSVKSTVLHKTRQKETQAWLFSAPDAPMSSCYMRLVLQYCKNPSPTYLEYIGLWTEPIAVTMDPLFMGWLAYQPKIKPQQPEHSHQSLKKASSFSRHRLSPSSSGRVASRSASAREMVHLTRQRSHGSGSELSKERELPAPQHEPEESESTTEKEKIALYERLRRLLISVEIGNITVYFINDTAPAVGCETVWDAIERYANATQPVLAFSLRTIKLSGSSSMRFLWQEIRNDGPTTHISGEKITKEDSFPWKMTIDDLTCYTLEVHRPVSLSGQEKSLQGLLKSPCTVTPRSMLDYVTTSVTLSVVVKTVSPHRKEEKATGVKEKETQPGPEEKRMQYFHTGPDFKPSTLKEFVRGPAKKITTVIHDTEEKNSSRKKSIKKAVQRDEAVLLGPILSIGVHVHADTPPIILRLDQDQMLIVSAAAHMLMHLLAVLRRAPLVPPRRATSHSTQRAARSFWEMGEEQSEDTLLSDTKSELISIYEAHAPIEHKLKTFFWAQWVISHATMIVQSGAAKLVFNIEDIIGTVDLHPHYSQAKLKISSASIKHFERKYTEEWRAAVLGGRVLEAREVYKKEESVFLGITITQARIADLPDSWKEELHPKVLQYQTEGDTMWELYATLAPLEAVMRPAVLQDMMRLLGDMFVRTDCSLEHQKRAPVKPVAFKWPYIYVQAGGLRLLLHYTDEEDDEESSEDDTFVLTIEQIDVSPLPANPIARRQINPISDMGVSALGGFEGRQYELFIRNVAIGTTQFSEIIKAELSEAATKGTTGTENPAVKWSQSPVVAAVLPLLHTLELNMVIAPPMFWNDALVCGPALELNFASDCSVELSSHQIVLAHSLSTALIAAAAHRNYSSLDLKDAECPFRYLFEAPKQPSDTVTIQIEEDTNSIDSSTTELPKTSGEVSAASHVAADSGVESVTNLTGTSGHHKRSITFTEDETIWDPMEYLEVYVTMGVVDLSLYVPDKQGDPTLEPLRPPLWAKRQKRVVEEDVKKERSTVNPETQSVRSVTDKDRNEDIGATSLGLENLARESKGMLPLIHLELKQPNLYYYSKRSQQNFQISLFDLWLGLGSDRMGNSWNTPLIYTAKGEVDPITEIPPALATLKLVMFTPNTAPSNIVTRGLVRLDVERPVQVEYSCDSVLRIKAISKMLSNTFVALHTRPTANTKNHRPALYQLRKFMVKRSVDTITVATTQLGVSSRHFSLGWAALSVQAAAGSRPDRLVAQGLLSSFLIGVGLPIDHRNTFLMPVTAGLELEAVWEWWRRMEGGAMALQPTISCSVELDRVTLDMRPQDYVHVMNAFSSFGIVLGFSDKVEIPCSNKDYNIAGSTSWCPPMHRSVSECDLNDQHYKDDLRSGAFKILSGNQIPMAYQVTLHEAAVSWRYPHPRAITRIVAFPLPDLNEEVDCVLEHYSSILGQWESLLMFKLPVSEPAEIKLSAAPPEAVYAMMWRCRTALSDNMQPPPYVFNADKFILKGDLLAPGPTAATSAPEREAPAAERVSAEQLCGVIRIDSYSNARATPRTTFALRLAALAFYAHCDMPKPHKQAALLEGYYVTKPLTKSHRVVGVQVRDVAAIAQVNPIAGTMGLLHAYIETEILDSSTGTMENLSNECRVDAAVSARTGATPSLRLRTAALAVDVSVPTLNTLHMVADDWRKLIPRETELPRSSRQLKLSKRDVQTEVAKQLSGRISIWIHNSCANSMRVGQESTEEVLPLSSGARLAYRWYDPNAVKRLRFALSGPSTDWQWSPSMSLDEGTTRIMLPESSGLGGGVVCVHARVRVFPSCRVLSLAGRLAVVNTLRVNLLYKVRVRCKASNTWQNIVSDELPGETVTRTVLCGMDCDLALKIKFTCDNDTGWSGDIPLKECPKENVPWLVKVPWAGDMPYQSVWCRVVRGRSDGRTLATIWPLYVLRSHLTLDTDVLISTEPPAPAASASTEGPPKEAERLPPLVISACGRGGVGPLPAPGTAAARHRLAFQYRNIDCPVTREAIPLHYGVTESSVFEKKQVTNNIEDVLTDIYEWMRLSGRNAYSGWPYSLVKAHWPGDWKPAMMQPRCDVAVSYKAVCAGGGCSLEVRLSPVVLLCNASTVALTLRGHDAAPLCRLEPGSALSPPSALVNKPFYISMEQGRETFVSPELRVAQAVAGVYEPAAPGTVDVERPAAFFVQCNLKVIMLTLYYEIRNDIHVFGISTSYVVLNKLQTDIQVSAVAAPGDVKLPYGYRPTHHVIIQPTTEGDVGTSLCRFTLCGRWGGGGGLAGLRAFFYVSLPGAAAVPVLLGSAPSRRSFTLYDEDAGKFMAVVVSQVNLEGRTVVSVASDPCPQLAVHNRTALQLCLGQPKENTGLCLSECAGSRWLPVFRPGARGYYSTPAYCARHPAADITPAPPLQLCVSHFYEELDVPVWSVPVAVAAGEQLVHLSAVTIKLRVQPQLHSTLLELLDVEYQDLSARDIRKRLGHVTKDEVSVSVPRRIIVLDDPAEKKLKTQDSDTKMPGLKSFDESGMLTSEPANIYVVEGAAKSGVRIADTVTLIGQNDDGTTEEAQYPIRSHEGSNVEKEREIVAPKDYSETSLQPSVKPEPPCASSDWGEEEDIPLRARIRVVVASVVVRLASARGEPVLVLHADRLAIKHMADEQNSLTTIAVSEFQLDNPQLETRLYDFGVVAATCATPPPPDAFPTLWGMFVAKDAFAVRRKTAKFLLDVRTETWTAHDHKFHQITELEICVGPLALYVEDAYVSLLTRLVREAWPSRSPPAAAWAETSAVERPLLLRLLLVKPLHVTFTLHTAIRMYIALDQSPLSLSEFRLTDMMVSTQRLTHALTVHYLSAMLLGAGWVVGGLELLGAPGALAARVGGASGGVRGVAAAAAAGVLRSLAAAAGSLARNLDLLAGDEEHALRAAAARRHPYDTLAAALFAGVSNFAINMLGAVGGLAHHPVVGMAVGETSGAAALRRGLVGAVAKPLAATADLVAYAGTGLLRQAGWSAEPQRRVWFAHREPAAAGWRRDCVRWVFRLGELMPLTGCRVTIDNTSLMLLLTHKYLVVVDMDTEHVEETIDFRNCSLSLKWPVISLSVTQRKTVKEPQVEEDEDSRVNAVAMARVARYTGAEGGGSGGSGGVRVLHLLPVAGRTSELHAALTALVQHNASTHLTLL